MDELTDTERQVLDFERAWWKHPGAKDAAIRDRFGWSPVRHYQVLNALLDRPAALMYDPMVVRRLVRVREARRGQRAG
jgi:hypothetical protein